MSGVIVANTSHKFRRLQALCVGLLYLGIWMLFGYLTERHTDIPLWLTIVGIIDNALFLWVIVASSSDSYSIIAEDLAGPFS